MWRVTSRPTSGRSSVAQPRSVKPDCYLLAEIWGDASPWLQGDMFDATMNYTFRDLCLDYFARDALTTADFLDGVTRMQAMYAPPVTAASHNLFSSHDTERFLRMAGEDPRRLRLAILFQLSIPGAPGIYYGDEIGMTGGFDPDCRRAFPWDAPETWDHKTLEMARALTHLRKAYPALRYGEWRPIWSSGEAFAFLRAAGDERILVAVNRGKEPVTISASVETAEPQLLWGEVNITIEVRGLTLHNLGAWAGALIRL